MSFIRLSSTSFARRLRRQTLAILIAGGVIGCSWLHSGLAHGIAEESMPSARGGISILIHRFDGSAQTDNSWSPVGTHDSVPMNFAEEANLVADEATPTDIADDVPPSDVSKEEPAVPQTKDGTLQQMVAAVLTTSATRLGVPLGSLVEPMSGLAFRHSETVLPTVPKTPDIKVTTVTPKEIANASPEPTPFSELSDGEPILNRWWLDSNEAVESLIAEIESGLRDRQSVDDLKSNDGLTDRELAKELDAIAAEEPLDVQTKPFIVDAEVSPPPVDESIVNDRVVGLSPMIVTVQESYMPYDFAARDLEFLSMPLTTVVPRTEQTYVLAKDQTMQVATLSEPRPEAYCLADGLVTEIQLPVETNEVTKGKSSGEFELDLPPEPAQPAFAKSPYCVLDEAIWTVRDWADRTDLDNWSLANAGERLGELLTRSLTRPANPGRFQPDGCPVPVPDPLPNASQERVQMAMADLQTDKTPSDDLTVTLMPTPDELPNASIDVAVAYEMVAAMADRLTSLRDAILQSWPSTHIATRDRDVETR
ncbi:MAG: hypothetical protein AAGJ40_03190 [Planctomycetota bacterium]